MFIMCTRRCKSNKQYAGQAIEESFMHIDVGTPDATVCSKLIVESVYDS